MALTFTGTLGKEWTDVVIDEGSGAIVWTNFTGNSVPGASDDVIIASSGVTINNSYFDHHSPQTGPVATFNLQITSAGSLTADYSQMTVHGSIVNNGTFTILTDQVKVLGGIVNNHLMTISGGSGSSYLLMDAGEFHLTGTGNLRLASNTDGTAFLTGNGGNITDFHNEGRVSGVGYIGWSNQQYYPGGYVAITNSGIIDANVSGRKLIVTQGTTDANPLNNTGSLVANGGGELVLDDAYIVQSSAGKIGAYGSGSKVTLNNVSVKGGFLDTSGGGAIYLETGGGYGAAGGGPGYAILDGSTASGAVTITTNSLLRLGVAGGVGTEAQLKGNIVNNGEIGLLGYWTALRIASSAKLTGGGDIVLSYAAGSGGNIGGAMLQGASDSVVSTLENVDNTIHGAGFIGRYDYGAYATKLLSVINRAGGVIEADNVAASLVIQRTVSFANAGILRASDGAELSIGGNIGNVADATTIDNKGGRIVADGTGSDVIIRGGTVRGGTLDTDNNGLIQLVGSTFSVLDGGTSQGAITNEGTLRIDGGLFRGAIVNKGAIGFHPTNAATLYIDSDDVALSGTGTLTLGTNSMIRGENSSATAVLVNSGIISGAGYIGTTPNGAGGELLTLDNRSGGILRATAGKTMVVDTTSTIVNAGILEANGGTLDLHDLISGTGTIRAVNGGTLKVRGDWTGAVTFSGSGQETLRHGTDANWTAGKTITLKGFGLGDRLDLAGESGYILSEPDNFSWVQSGENGSFRFSVGGTLRSFVFEGLSQLHLKLVDNGAGGLFLKRVATIDGTSGNNTLSGTAGHDRMVGFAGNDTFRGSAGNDRMDGGTGIDTINYSTATAAIKVSLATTAFQAIGGGQGSDSLRFIENVIGSGFGDTITGNSAANLLKGGAGNDTLNGGSGIDRLEGGTGNDTFIVDHSSDVVIELSGQGTDTVRASAHYTLSSHVENLTLTGSAALNGTGNTLANKIIGTSGKNTLKGGAGNDTLDGAGGVDLLEGGTGNDTFIVDNTADVVIEFSGEGTDLVKAAVSYRLAANIENLTLTGSGKINGTGNSLNNVMTGNDAGNTLSGGSGNDTLYGRAGADKLYGGSGKDTFIFKSTKDITTSKTATDTIFDFDGKAGDRIDLSGIDAKGATSQDDGFTFIDTKAFSKKAGELRYEKAGSDTYIYGDTNADGKADFVIHLDDALTLSKEYFVL